MKLANTIFVGAYLEIVLPPEIPLAKSMKGDIIVTANKNMDGVNIRGVVITDGTGKTIIRV